MRIFMLVLIPLALISCDKDETDPLPEPEWKVYTTANSLLPDNQINSIAIDRNNVKWIGTAQGLAQINGDNWIVFNASNSSLPSSFVQALAVEANGTVWVGTNKGLVSYNGKAWVTFTPANSLLPDDAIMSLAHDKVSGTTWVGTAKGLLSIGKDGTWHLYDDIEDDLILSMAVMPSGVLWLGTFNHFAFRGAIRKLEDGKWTTYHLDQMGYPSAFPYSVVVGQDQSVTAVLTGTTVKSVIQLRNDEWSEISGPQEAAGLRTLVLEGDRVWVGGKALYLYDHSSSLSIPLIEKDQSILSMALDNQGRKWLGTFHGGLAVYSKRQ